MIIINNTSPARDIHAIIFDFDGLILETEEADFCSWHEVYEQHGARLLLEDWLPLIGTGSTTNTFDPYQQLEQRIERTIDRDAIRTWRRRRYLELVEAKSLLPGVMETIEAAQRLGLMLAVASSSTRAWVTGHLTRHSLLAHFGCVICGNDAGIARTKPYPDIYLAALAELGVRPEQAIALEDSPNGVQAAREAGIFCIAVPGPLTRHCIFDHANMQLTSLSELVLSNRNQGETR